MIRIPRIPRKTWEVIDAVVGTAILCWLVLVLVFLPDLLVGLGWVLP